MSLLVEHTMSLKFVNYTKKKIKNNKIKPNSPERLTLLLTYTVPCCLFQTNEKFLTQRKYSHQKDYLASEFQKQRHITDCVKHCFNKHVFKNDDNYFVATTTLKLLLPHTKNANPKLFWVLQITRKMSITWVMTVLSCLAFLRDSASVYCYVHVVKKFFTFMTQRKSSVNLHDSHQRWM